MIIDLDKISPTGESGVTKTSQAEIDQEGEASEVLLCGETITTLREEVNMDRSNLRKIVEWFSAWKENPRPKDDNKDEEENINKGRRKFLKLITLAGVGMGVEMYGLGSVAELISKENDEELADAWDKLSPEEQRQISGVVQKYDITNIEVDKATGEIIFGFSSYIGNKLVNKLPEEEVKSKVAEWIKEERKVVDYKVFKNIFIEQYLKNGKLDINLEIKKGVQEMWKKKYAKGGNYHKGLMEALNRMKPWYNEIKQVFNEISQKEGIETPPEIIYLAIAESHCKVRDKSSAFAGGYYQLMPLIAKDKGIVIRDGIDERFDILENARVAAKYLIELYKEFKTDYSTEEDAWQLALARYNGTYSKIFRNHIRDSDYLKNYKTFLEFRESKLNDYLNDVFRQGYFENYRIKKGVTLDDVATENDLDINMLKRVNQNFKVLKDYSQKISIPLFQKNIKYQVEKGDNLDRVAEMYKVDKDIIAKHSDNIDKIGEGDAIKEGDILIIEINDEDGEELKKSLEIIFKLDLHEALENLNYPEKFYAIIGVLKEEDLIFKESDDTYVMKKVRGGNKTLRQISKKYNIALKSLKAVNAHILKDDVKIPNDVGIYISPKIIATKHRQTKKFIKEQV